MHAPPDAKTQRRCNNGHLPSKMHTHDDDMTTCGANKKKENYVSAVAKVVVV